MGNAPNMMVDMDGGWSGGGPSLWTKLKAFVAGGNISNSGRFVFGGGRSFAGLGKAIVKYGLPAAASVGRSYESLNRSLRENISTVDPGVGLAEFVDPNSFNIKKIGDAYYTSASFKETMIYLDVKNVIQLKMNVIELSFNNISLQISSRNWDGTWKSKLRVQEELAWSFNTARALVYEDLSNGEIEDNHDANDKFIKYLNNTYVRAHRYPFKNVPKSIITFKGGTIFPTR